MQIPVLNGIYTDGDSNFRTSYPRNLIPVPTETGISKGYLRPAEGIVEFGTGSGIGRGGIEWKGVCYRVLGPNLVKVLNDGSTVDIGYVGGVGEITMDYSFDYLGICANKNLFLYDGSTLQQITDPDLGDVYDFIWIDGFFMFTDGEFVGVTDLNNPFQVNPLKYGSSEVDPDPIKAILKLRNEPQVLNRFTVEAFSNVGGSGFPYQRIDGAQITRGVIGTHACCIYMDNVAFLGGGRNESIAVWVGSNGNTAKISTHEIDTIINSYTDGVLESARVEARVDKGHQWLYIHLLNQTLVYDGPASQLVGEPVWFTLDSGLVNKSKYRAKNFVRCYDKWLVEDPTSTKLGYVVESISSHWNTEIGWLFGTMIVYNAGRGTVFHELELVCLTGRIALGDESTVWTSYSTDGETWSQEKPVSVGTRGQRNKRLVWFRQGFMRNWRIQKFRGTSSAHISIVRLEARIEQLEA